nr:MAG TPA: hypothetical protein [Caudoviricetes sp.]
MQYYFDCSICEHSRCRRLSERTDDTCWYVTAMQRSAVSGGRFVDEIMVVLCNIVQNRCKIILR